MADLIITANPRDPGATCGNCKCWLKSEAKNVAYVNTPNGMQQIPLSDLVKSGQKIDKDWPTARVAPCTFLPMWMPNPEQHWCFQHIPRVTQ